MKTFLVPALEGETHPQYSSRVSGMAWQFDDIRELSIVEVGTVSLNGDKPIGADFEEVL